MVMISVVYTPNYSSPFVLTCNSV